MLNKHGGGELYFGVKDNGNVVGQEVTDATIRQVAGWVSDKIEPPISPTIERLASDDSRAYVRVAFSGVEGPYSADGWESQGLRARSRLMIVALSSEAVIALLDVPTRMKYRPSAEYGTSTPEKATRT